jgi:hypothetical protein
MTDTPEDWILIEAAKRSGLRVIHNDLRELRLDYAEGHAYRALCDMIAKHEEKPVDRKLLCAREAVVLAGGKQFSDWANGLMQQAAIGAIELWEEGFGK